MVLIKSGLMSQMSGSIAGATFSRNRGGAYMRARTKPINPATPNQVAVRSVFSEFASLYAGLDETKKRSWEAYAQGAVFLNRLGDAIIPSAISVYVASNSLLALAGLNPVTDAPVTTTRPSLVIPDGAVFTWADNGDGSLTGVTVANATGGKVIVQSSIALTAGQRSTKQTYRSLVRGLVSSMASLSDTFDGKHTYTIGNEFAVRVRVIRPDGAYSEPYFLRGEATTV